MDREMVEHLAQDTGLRPDEIVARPTGPLDDRAPHLAADTGLAEEDFVDEPREPHQFATGPID
jgi:hypothetical protein